MESLLQLLIRRFPDIAEKELYARVLCGEILVDGERVRDPGARVTAEVQISQQRRRYVSRGGDKLHAALERWPVPVKGRVFLDAGASTGGFTDCLLRFGAEAVHAVDVGYNQLDYQLRRDPRVIVHERTNLMGLHALDPSPDAAVADLSFRSLRGAARKLLSLTREGWAIVLVKPQFEFASTLKVGRDDSHGHSVPTRSSSALDAGVIRDRSVLLDILLTLRADLAADGISVRRVLASPVVGRRGNREFLFLIGLDAEHSSSDGPLFMDHPVDEQIRKVVSEPGHTNGRPE